MDEWADKYRYLSSESSADAQGGAAKWYTDRTPYMREPYRCVTDPEVETIVLESSSQVGKTEFLLNVTGYFMHQDPAPILLLEPTLEIAEAYSKDRFAPMIRDTPMLQAVLSKVRSKDSDNTILHKKYFGGHVTLAGSNSPAALSSRPIRVLLCDEVDRYAPSAGTEGEPLALATKRTTTFWNKKILIVSSPTTKSQSRIDPAFEASDKRYFHVPCHKCKTFQKLTWAQVKWSKKDGEHEPESAVCVCAHCGAAWDDAERAIAVHNGKWIAEAAFKGVAGFHLWEAYNPWVKLSKMVTQFLDAKHADDQGNPEPLKVFTNTTLGQCWIEKGETISADPLLSRRENYSADAVPWRVLYLTAGIDIQDDRIEVGVYGWRADNRKDPEESWGIEKIKLLGAPAKPQIWQELDEVLLREWTTEDGRKLKLGAVAIDSGHFTLEVYRFCSKRYGRHVYAVKGRQGALPIWPMVASKSKKHRGNKVFIVGVDTAKDTIYSRLRIKSENNEGGPGYCHFSLSYDAEFFKQLTCERVQTRFVKGHPIREWFKPQGARNEDLDTFAYALAVLHARPVPWEVLAKAAPSEPPPLVGTTQPTVAPVQPSQQPKPVARPVRFRFGRQ